MRRESGDLQTNALGELAVAAGGCFDEELEAAVLGAALLERKALPVVLEKLDAECFYAEGHRVVYGALRDLFAAGLPVDVLTVIDRLRTTGRLDEAGGVPGLARITSGVYSAAHLEYHCCILRQLALRRSAVRLLHGLLAQAAEAASDVYDLLLEGLQGFQKLVDGTEMLGSLHDMDEVMRLTLEAGRARRESATAGLTGVDTGLRQLNRLTGGWQPGTLVCTAARPGDGKTALDLFFARSAARSGVPVVVFSMEMGARELGDRLLLGVADIGADEWKAGTCTDGQMAEAARAAEELRGLPIRVDDTPYNSVDQLCVVAQSLHAKGQCGLVIVDYLQLLNVSRPGRTREQEVAECCRKLKALARKLDCPVIISSQLNRQSEGMPARMPELSHLRESGAIEQDSDMVVLLYRPERCRMRVYGERKLPTEGMLVAIVAKHRNGRTGELIFRHNPAMTRMCDWPDE